MLFNYVEVINYEFNEGGEMSFATMVEALDAPAAGRGSMTPHHLSAQLTATHVWKYASSAFCVVLRKIFVLDLFI